MSPGMCPRLFRDGVERENCSRPRIGRIHGDVAAGLTKWARRSPPAGEAAGCSVAKTKGRNLLGDSGHNYE